jgi:hypothetical protein
MSSIKITKISSYSYATINILSYYNDKKKIVWNILDR